MGVFLGHNWLCELVDCSCPYDLDGNAAVGTSDLLILLAAWYSNEPDFDGSGFVDTGDLLDLLANWGACE